jgi:branched-chain amino acid transport system ATP-binding protein
MLEIASLSVSYGKHRAVDNVALTVARSEIVVILGANGSGKTSLLKTIGGIQPAGTGATITLSGADLTKLRAHAIVEAGLALVPEGRGIFGDLTVRENLMLGAYAKRARATESQNLERVLTLFPRLSERMTQAAPHHERRRTADGRDRPGADVGAGYPVARRTVTGPVAADVR